MKQLLFAVLISGLIKTQAFAQSPTLSALVQQLDGAQSEKEYKGLAGDFQQAAEAESNNWLPWYYAAYCNARIGWLNENNGEAIEPFADQAEAQLFKAMAATDTSAQKNIASELYVVWSMINRARVFINPMTYGRQYGPASGRYLRRALELNATNPRALYLAGWEKNATPKMWGGDKEKAKQLLDRSIQLFDSFKPEAGDVPHWGKKEAQTLRQKIK